MIVSWNVRGLNNVARCQEVGSHLLRLNVHIAILVETRIKQGNADKVCRKLGSKWNYVDNYAHHANGHTWSLWDSSVVTVQVMQMHAQFVNMRVFKLDGQEWLWVTTVYAFNHLERILRTVTGAWVLIIMC